MEVFFMNTEKTIGDAKAIQLPIGKYISTDAFVKTMKNVHDEIGDKTWFPGPIEEEPLKLTATIYARNETFQPRDEQGRREFICTVCRFLNKPEMTDAILAILG